MTKSELKAELTALYDQAIITGTLPKAEAEKLCSLWSHRAEVAELVAEDAAFKAKGRLISGLIRLELQEAHEAARIRKQGFVERQKANDGSN